MQLKRPFVVRLAIIADVFLFILLAILVIMEAYTRYSVNQTFTFLGGWGLPALMFSFVALTIGILYRENTGR